MKPLELQIPLPSSLTNSLNQRKMSWTPHDLRSPDGRATQQLFNSLKDFYDHEAIVHNLKKLNTVPERLCFIDMLLKRRDEITEMDELAQINKLGPIFEKVKQRFMKKINEKKALQGQSKTRSSLFRRNSVLTPYHPSQTNFTERRSIEKPAIIPSSSENPGLKPINSYNNNQNHKNNNNLVEMMSTHRKRATIFTVVSGFNERKTLFPSSNSNDKVQKNDRFQRKKKSISLVSPQYIRKLEKELFHFAIINKKNAIFDMCCSNKQVLNIDSCVKSLLSEFKSSKTHDHKIYLKNLENFSSEKVKGGKTLRNKIITRYESSEKAKIKVINGDIDDSFVSFTETRLDQLYKQSQSLRNQLQNLEHKSFLEEDVYEKETRDKKIQEIEKTSKEIANTINRKFQRYY